MTTTTTTTDKAKARPRKKEPLKTGYQILRDYRQKYPEKDDLIREVKRAIKEQKDGSQWPDFNPLVSPVFTGMRSLILGAFEWSESHQGLDYWMQVYDCTDD